MGCELAKLLVIDNYDSFTYNLVQMFMHYDLDIEVHRCDRISIGEIETLQPDYILISPGPKDPAHAGISVQLVKALCGKIPILGICLGMQCINEAFWRQDRSGAGADARENKHGSSQQFEHLQEYPFSFCCRPLSFADR